MSFKLLTEHNLECLSLKRGCTGSSESPLVKIPHCWKSHITAQLFLFSDSHCMYNNSVHKTGESFNSTDGCNTCFCYHGYIGCTERACAPIGMYIPVTLVSVTVAT